MGRKSSLRKNFFLKKNNDGEMLFLRSMTGWCNLFPPIVFSMACDIEQLIVSLISGFQNATSAGVSDNTGAQHQINTQSFKQIKNDPAGMR